MIISIIGGGASGLSCAIEAKRTLIEQKTNADVVIYEKLGRVGKKILATGNGRCNLTNENADIEYYFGETDFAEYALAEYSVKSNIEFFRSMGLFTFSEEGRVYPLSSQASSVLDALRFECERLGVKIFTDSEIKTIKATTNGFLLNSSIKSDFVVISAGGKSAKVHGTNGDGAELLKQLGHSITDLCPALVSLNADNFPKSLKGIRAKCEAILMIDGEKVASAFGEIQFCDYGLSGIPIMEISRFVSTSKSKDISIILDNVPTFTEDELIANFSNMISHNNSLILENLLSGILPKQLGITLLKECKINPQSLVNTVSLDNLKTISHTLKNWNVKINSARGFDFSQVTAGGAKCSEFDNQTMQSCKVNNLYSCGEVLNIDGGCGGYNLQWAWSSGRLSGRSVASSIIKNEVK